MQNLSIVWDAARSRGDLALSGAGLLTGGAIEAAVAVSLFTDRVAASDDVISDGTDDRRGWWGDTFASRPIGSRMWLLLRAKATNETLNKAKDFVTEALQWLLDDGVAARVDVVTQWIRRGQLGALVTIYQQDGTRQALSYSWAWE